MTLTPDEILRFQHQIHLPEVGMEGQHRLKNAKVACVGAGGLGSPLLLYLAAAGIGTIGIIDDDIVETNNLHRQILYNDKDVGCPKVSSAAEKLSTYPVKINTYNTRLTPANAQEILNDYDIIADCSDNFSTRFLLNDICFLLDKPLVSASIHQFEGQCLTMHGKRGPCLRCLFPEIPRANVFQNCEEAGVLNVLPGLFGLMQAIEVIKWILQKGDLLLGRVITIDVLKMQFKEYHLSKNPDCELCMNRRMMRDIQESGDLDNIACKKGENDMRDFIITSHELNALMKKNAEIELIDVRTNEKHQSYNIGGKNIPIAELSDRLNELNPDKMIVTYCSSGGNSMRALQLLLSKGFHSVKSLDGGMTAWQNEIKS